MPAARSWGARGAALTGFLIAALISIVPGTARADDDDAPVTRAAGPQDRDDEGVETENLFGFTTGSDVGEPGETELTTEIDGAFGKRDGRYTAWRPKLEIGHTPFRNFAISLGASLAYHRIEGVTGLDDVDRWMFDTLSLEMKYRFLERGASPIGLTLVVEPEWGRVEEDSGERVTKYGAEIKLAADAELVPERLFAAVNVLYEPERVREADGEVEKESTFGLSAALTGRVVEGVFLGGELRYLRKYEGLGLETFTGDALFAGPTLYVSLPNDWWASAAWNIQVAGQSEDEPELDLNLDQFARHEVKFRLGTQF